MKESLSSKEQQQKFIEVWGFVHNDVRKYKYWMENTDFSNPETKLLKAFYHYKKNKKKELQLLQQYSKWSMKQWSMYLKERDFCLGNLRMIEKSFFSIAKKCNFLYFHQKLKYPILLINISLKRSFFKNHKKC